MANDAAETFIAGDGHIYLAPFGTAMPTAIDSVLNAAFKDVGYLTSDGFRMTPSLDTFDLDAWQSDSPIRSNITRRNLLLSLDFLQGNTENLPTYFGGGEFVGTVYSPPDGAEINEQSMVADVFDGDRQWRFWFPKVTLAAQREVAFVRSAAAQWGVDLKVLKVAGTDLFNFDRDDDEFPAYPG